MSNTSAAHAGYLETVEELYRKAAEQPMAKLCCTTSPVWRMPGLAIPDAMLEMNYGCGTTVHPADLRPTDRILYVGVGSGMEALQFSYFGRRPGCVVAMDTVDEMLATARRNLTIAAEVNAWFEPEFVSLRRGNALALPLADATIQIAAQNCLFNVFTREHLALALGEMHRVLTPGGRLFLSDPVATWPIPDHLAADRQLRAECLSGALPLNDYIAEIVSAGFGTVEVRRKSPYRLLDRSRYGLDAHLLLESVEVCAIKDPIPADGPCVFTGRAAVYFGPEETFDDGNGHVLVSDLPAAVCDKTAKALITLGRDDLIVTESTWHYEGGGCC